MGIAKVDEFVKAAFDSINGPLLIWISSKIQDANTGVDLDKLYDEMPSERIDFLQIVKQIDKLPLTRKDYEKYYTYADVAVKKANDELSAVRDRARKMMEDKLKDILKNYLFYDGKNKDRIFEVLYKKAYEEGHEDGYRSVSVEFFELNNLFHDVFKAMRYQTPSFRM